MSRQKVDDASTLFTERPLPSVPRQVGPVTDGEGLNLRADSCSSMSRPVTCIVASTLLRLRLRTMTESAPPRARSSPGTVSVKSSRW